MSRKLLKRLVMAVLVVVGLPLLLLGLASVLVPRDKLAAQIAAEVATATGAEVEPGTAALKVVGGLGLRLSGGVLRGTGAELARRTGAGEGLGAYELKYSQLAVSLDFGALVHRQLVARKIVLAGPVLMVETSSGPIRLADFSVVVSNLRLDLAAAGTAETGPAPGDKIPAGLTFELEARVGGVEVGGVTWDAVHLAGAWADRRLAVEELTVRLAEGMVSGTGEVDYGEDRWGRAAWNLQLNQVPAGPLLRPFMPELGARLSCDLDGEISGSLGLRDKAVQQQTLTVDGQLRAGEGVLRAEDWLQEAAPYLGERQDLTTIHFDRLAHRFRIRDGRYIIDALELAGPDTDWQAVGWLGFAGDLALRVGVRLPAGFTPDLGGMSFLAETLRDDEGRVRLGLKLSGRMAAPQIGLDFGSLGGSH